MFKDLTKQLFYLFVFVFTAIGVFAMLSTAYCYWYNRKYEVYNVVAVPDYFGSFKYVAKQGYHLEALCTRALEPVRIPRIDAYNYLTVFNKGERFKRGDCEILVVKDIIIVPPLSDYEITEPKTK